MSLEILKGLKGNYEFHHGVTITHEALITANRLAHRYISDRCLPDKAIDLIDEAAAQLKIESASKPKAIEDKGPPLPRVTGFFTLPLKVFKVKSKSPDVR